MSNLVAYESSPGAATRTFLTPAALVFGLLALAALALLPTLRSLESYWRDVHDYHHGYLIGLVTLGWLYTRRHDLNSGEVRGSWPATGLLAVVLALAVWAGAGPRAAHAVLRPLAYLYFAIPVWDFLAPLLQQMTVTAAQAGMALAGVPTVVRDVTVKIPEGTFMIVEGCSGKKFLIAALATAALAAAVGQFDRRRFLSLLGLAAVLAVLANWIRVLTVITVGHLSHMQNYLVRVEHRSFGNAIWVALLLLILWLAHRLAPPAAAAAAQGTPAPATAPVARAGVVGALLLIGAAALAAVDTHRPPVGATIAPLPLLAAAWQGPLPGAALWQPSFAGAAVERRGAYESINARIELYANVYGDQAPGRKLASSDNRLLGPGEWEETAAAGAVIARGALLGDAPQLLTAIAPDGRRWVVSYSYYVGAARTASGALAQALYGAAAVVRAPAAGVVAVAAPCAADSCEAAGTDVRAFWSQARAPIERLIASAASRAEGAR